MLLSETSQYYCQQYSLSSHSRCSLNMEARNARTRDVTVDVEVLDFHGLPGEDDGTMANTVSIDAYLALKSAFKELKARFFESDQRCNDLSKRVKKKGAKDSAVEQVCRERDDLLEKLMKSYAAFQEKYAENEELQKEVEEMKREIETSEKKYKEKEEENGELMKQLEALAIEIANINVDFREQKNELEQLRILQQVKEEGTKLEQKTPEVVDSFSQTLTSSLETLTLDALLKRMKDYGLQVAEGCETLIILIVDREKLRVCLEACADKSATGIFDNFLSEGNAETKKFYSAEEFSLASNKHMEAEGKVIRLKQKVEDQAAEIRRLRKLYSIVAHHHAKCNKEKQKTLENEAEDLQRSLGKGAVSKEQTDGGSTQVKTELENEKRYGDLLRKVVGIIAQLNDLYKELDTQGQCVQQLIQMTQTLSTKTREKYNTRRHLLAEERHQTRIDDLLCFFAEDDAKHLSIPVQETQKSFPARTIGVAVKEIPYSSGGGSDEEAGEISKVEELVSRPVEEEPPSFGQVVRGPSVESASAHVGGREFPRRQEESGSSASDVSRPSFERVETGESDIEVIEESDQQLGATSMQGRLCPVCEFYFPSSHGQDEFERHVRNHFEDD